MDEATFTDKCQQERRHSIQLIMADETLTPLEKGKRIQSLMDGRRRSSATTSTSAGSAAAEVAMSYASDTEGSTIDGSSSHLATSSYSHQSHHHQEPSSQGMAAMDISGGNNSGRRQRRSASLPGWSEAGMPAAAPALAAASGNTIWDNPLNVSRRMEKSRPPCTHYERNCTIVSPCCGVAFGCRICHDDCPVLPMPFSKRKGAADAQGAARVNWADTVEAVKQKQEKRRSLPLGFDGGEETHHEIDRFAIHEVICRLCYTRQSSKT
eukprot:scaffold3267_cov140-Cylindrotheca_fusiformis.AAC.6